MRQTLRFPGRESPFLCAYDLASFFNENQEMSLVCSDLNKCLLEEVDFLTSKWLQKEVHFLVNFERLTPRHFAHVFEKGAKNENPR